MSRATVRIVPTLATLLLATALATPAAAAPKPAPGTTPHRHAAIVADYDTGEILYTHNGSERRAPASLTKMLTLYLVFEALEGGRLTRDQELTVSAHAASMEPSKLGVPAGGTISVDQAILAIVTKSANDMAVVLAEALAGSEEEFARRMTARAGELGMSGSSFRNASGLPHHEHYSTARDMLILSRALISRFPGFYRLFSTGAFEYGNMRYPNMNSFLRTYAGADGIKTGYTRAAGHCLAASAVRAGRRMVGVVLGGPSLAWTRGRMTMLVDTAFNGVPQDFGQPGTMVASIPAASGTAAPSAATATTPATVAVVATASPNAAAASVATGSARRASIEPQPAGQGGIGARAGVSGRATVAPRRRIEEKTARVATAAPAAREPAPVRRPAADAPADEVLAHATGSSPARGIVASQAHTGPVVLAGSTTPPTSGNWQVRVETRPDLGSARRRADAIRNLLSPSLQGARIQLTPGSNAVEIAAVDLDQAAARSLCADLQRAAVPCIVIAPGREVYVTRR